MVVADPSQLADGRVGARTIRFLNLLRGVAILLVVYDHLGAVWPEAHGRSWFVNRFVRRWVNEPLGIIQDFGFLGVAIFFLISGFVITHVAQRETRIQFVVKRLLRIYPALAVSIVLVALFTALRGRDLRPLGDYAEASTLANYFRAGRDPVNGVAWTLVIEMLFYGLVAVVLPWIASRPLWANLAMLGTVAAAIVSAKSFGDSWFLFAASMAFVPYLLLGQLLYLRWTQRITTAQYALATVATYAVAVEGIRRIHTEFLPADNSYMISVAIAFGIFVTALFLEESIRVPQSIGFVSDISYSLYLMHGVIGYYVLDQLVGRVPFTAAVAVAFGAGLALATASHRFVEVPSQNLARAILRRRTPAEDPPRDRR